MMMYRGPLGTELVSTSHPCSSINALGVNNFLSNGAKLLLAIDVEVPHTPFHGSCDTLSRLGGRQGRIRFLRHCLMSRPYLPTRN